jgi:hypothetical protein
VDDSIGKNYSELPSLQRPVMNTTDLLPLWLERLADMALAH